MKKHIIKIVYLVLVFVAALMIISRLINEEHVDMTAKMADATLPMVQMQIGQQTVNTLHGYVNEMDVSHMHGPLMPTDNDRTVHFSVLRFDSKVDKVFVEVRTMDGSSLIEDSEITNLQVDEAYDRMDGAVRLKDLIEPDTEYMMVFCLETGGRTVRYYSRVIWNPDKEGAEQRVIDVVQAKIDFVKQFHENTFEPTEGFNLVQYLEPNRDADNTTFGRVNIHNSYKQVTWNGVEILSHSEPYVTIEDLTSGLGSFTLTSQIRIRDEQGLERLAFVSEYFRIRYTTKRSYLLDYDRTVDTMFNAESGEYDRDGLNLFLQGSDVQLQESSSGSDLAFLAADRLFSYNGAEKKVALLYGFYDEDHMDERTTLHVASDIHRTHHMTVLRVDEGGNVTFQVAGYMERGTHEGEVGVAVFTYDAMLNIIEERIWIPDQRDESIVCAAAERLYCVSNEERYYSLLHDSITSIRLTDREQEEVVRNITAGTYRITEDGSLVAWQDDAEQELCTNIHMVDLNTQKRTEINSPTGDVVRPIGFMDEDFVYGLVHSDDVQKDLTGNLIYPMYKLVIQDREGNVLENYQMDGLYVMNVEIGNQQLRLDRATKNEETGTFSEAPQDQIMSTLAREEEGTHLTDVLTENLGYVRRITFRNSSEDGKLKRMTPGEIIFEGSRSVEQSGVDAADARTYYVYARGNVIDITRREAESVATAEEAAGRVLDDTNRCIWQKQELAVRNQIMSLTRLAQTAAEEGRLSGEDTTSACLDLVLQYEGINRNVTALREAGQSSFEILSAELPKEQILDLKGCSLSSILYYVNQDIPVLASLQDGSSVVVIGFNEFNTVLLDPSKPSEPVYKLGMQDSEKLFEKNGNLFITLAP